VASSQPPRGFYGERFIYNSGMRKNTMVNVLVNNSEWRIPTTQAIGWYPIIDIIPSNFNPKIRKMDEIVWLDAKSKVLGQSSLGATKNL
jgi:uncharacterized protein YbaR (Trm112 family)